MCAPAAGAAATRSNPSVFENGMRVRHVRVVIRCALIHILLIIEQYWSPLLSGSSAQEIAELTETTADTQSPRCGKAAGSRFALSVDASCLSSRTHRSAHPV